MSINAGEIASFNDAIVAGRWTVAAPNTDPGRPFNYGATIFGYLDVRVHASGTWVFQEFKSAESNYIGVWRRQNINATGWGKWEHSATATPPQEYALPLAAGVTGTVRYSKDQFGTIRLSGLISFPSDTTEISIFGTLPNGFRPQNGQYISSCGWLEGGANVVPLMLAVNADGTVAANMFAASTKHVVVQAVFLAA